MESLSFVVSFLLYLLIAAPACLAMHELGHAAMILLLTDQRSTFQFGGRGTRREMVFGRLTCVLYPELRALFFCRYRLENAAALTTKQDAAITLGGPLTSLVFTILFGLLWWRFPSGGDPWSGLTMISLFNFLIASVPGDYPRLLTGEAGIANDGLQLVRLLRQPEA